MGLIPSGSLLGVVVVPLWRVPSAVAKGGPYRMGGIEFGNVVSNLPGGL